jgi:hypothetical protein
MKLQDMAAKIFAQPIYEDEQHCSSDFSCVFASDLMSSALAMINENQSETVLLTGLSNAQAIRTAEMLDLKAVFFVRNKVVPSDVVDLAKISGISVYSSPLTMFESCGRLYQAGIVPPCKVEL